MDAAIRFEPSRGVPFDAFASRRIHGAIYDSLRAKDTLSRDMRRVSTGLKRANAELENSLKRDPTEDEIADHMGISIEEVRERRAKLSGWSVVGFDDVGPAFLEHTADEHRDTFLDMTRTEQAEQLEDAIRTLPLSHQRVLALRFAQDLTLQEIGDVMGFTESRACQILKLATESLRDIVDPELLS